MNNYLYVPDLNGFRFLDENSLFDLESKTDLEIQQEHIGFSQVTYCQKYEAGTTRKIQWQSDYAANRVELLDKDKNVVSQFPVGPTNIVKTTVDGVNYYELSLVLNQIGVHFLRIEAAPTTAQLGTAKDYISEPIAIATKWDNCFLFEFSNYEDDENLHFEDGFTANLLVECLFYKRSSQTENHVFRSSTGRGRNLSSRVQKRYTVNYLNLPAYLWEQLTIGLSLSEITVSGNKFICSEGLGDVSYSNSLYQRGASEAILERID